LIRFSWMPRSRITAHTKGSGARAARPRKGGKTGGGFGLVKSQSLVSTRGARKKTRGTRMKRLISLLIQM